MSILVIAVGWMDEFLVLENIDIHNLVHKCNVQVNVKACKDPYTNLNPMSGVNVYTPDFDGLIRGKYLTGTMYTT